MPSIQISGLYTYPIKSCGGIRHQAIDLDQRGLTYDRRWVVTDPLGQFFTMREYHQMALIQPMLTDSEMILTYPDMPTLHIPLATGNGKKREVVVWKSVSTAVDEGDEVAAWFSQILGTPSRLFKMADDFYRKTSTEFTDVAGELGFADGYPILFISQASLDDLNVRLTEQGKDPVPMSRFRPNVVLSGTQAYAEDTWKHVTISGIRFDIVKPCARCVMTTVDPTTGQVPDVKEPLATLASYRKSPKDPLFGQNVIHRGVGILSVGDTIREAVHE
jgi:hypothetical protein